MPDAKRCVSRRKLTIKLRQGAGVKIRSVAAWVNGARKRVRAGGGSAPVILRNLPSGKAIVRLKVKPTTAAASSGRGRSVRALSSR